MQVVFIQAHGPIALAAGHNVQLPCEFQLDAMIAEVTMLDTGSPTRTGSDEAKAIATKYGLEFLPS